MKEINNLTFNFIWEGKPAKIKKKTIISDIKRGGLKMLDFEIIDKALKITYIDTYILYLNSSLSRALPPSILTTTYMNIS